MLLVGLGETTVHLLLICLLLFIHNGSMYVRCAYRKLKRTSPLLHQQQNVLLPPPLLPAAIALPLQALLVVPEEHHHLEQQSKSPTSCLPTHFTILFLSGYSDIIFFLCHPMCISIRQSPRYRPPSPSGVKQRPPSPQLVSKTPPVQKPALTPTGPPVLRKREPKSKDVSPMTALTSQPQDTSTASPAPSTKPKDGENCVHMHLPESV